MIMRKLYGIGENHMKNLLFHPQYLRKKQIEELLKQAKNIPLILLIAPMGYGKTTIIQNFLEKVKGTKIWIFFRESEVDEDWIWTRLCEKIKDIGFPFASLLRQNGLPKNQYEIDNIIDILKDSFSEPVYLILDGVHECKRSILNSLIESIVYRRIKNLHIILSSRTYPNIKYEEMWVKGYCILVEQSLMAFSKEEICQFFKLNGIMLKEEEEKQIYEYTEGWISAIYLVLLDYKQSGYFKNKGGINHLIHSFIFEKMSDEGKQILMMLSLIDDFQIEQAVYITQMEICRYILPELVETIGFVKFNSNSKSYSLHAVLRSVVSIELEKSDIDKSKIYTRCGEWYEKNKKYIYAIENYNKAGNKNKIFDIIEKCHCSILYEEAPTVIENFFTNVSKEECLKHPIAYLPYINEIIINNNNIKGRVLYEEAEEYYRMYGCKGLSKKQLMGELYLVKWNLEFNNLEKMTQCARRAYKLMENKRSIVFHSDVILTYGAPEILFLYHSRVGKLKETIELEKKYTFYYMRLINGYEGGWDQLFEAEYYFTIGELEKAEELAEIVSEKAIFRKQACVIISSFFLRLRCQIHFGNRKKFEQLLGELKQKMEGELRLTIRMDYEIAISYVYGCIGQTERIAPWLADFELENCSRIMRSTRSGCVSFGINLIKKEEWIQLIVLAEKMSVPYSTSNHIFVLIYADIYYAIAEYHLNGIKQGLKYLKKGIELAKPDGIKMPFVENICFIEPLLLELSKIEILATQIIDMGKKQKKGILLLNKEKEKMEKILLTERELELMQLVAKGDKNIQISQKLNIALVTVEKKLTNIYRKLDVSNRAAAIARLRELKWIK